MSELIKYPQTHQVFFTIYKCSMYILWVTRHASRWLSNSFHAFCSVILSIAIIAGWLFLQLADNWDFIFQKDGAPNHWHIHVSRYLNDQLPQRWIGRIGDVDFALFLWPSRSPYLTLLLTSSFEDSIRTFFMTLTTKNIRGAQRTDLCCNDDH
ncbi:hypothetical protein AVEN_206041-1 [Araneus ventricosus]|uniref:Uncharacterized protein n=1 Tax=Araneus ventricosus TaxID=182803 RepID=A0A4Y2BRV4_ARAVE|nr:hypothetical protein AVEN_141909-1 [Araneus ventricosus]GBL94778.1 hypothetical protein AVEN_206041-1 [Araneus ventricosus]